MHRVLSLLAIVLCTIQLLLAQDLPDATVYFHCDNYWTAYIDGVAKKSGDYWPTEYKVTIPSPTKETVFDIQCQDVGVIGGFIATVYYLDMRFSTTYPITEGNWQVTYDSEQDYNLVYYPHDKQIWQTTFGGITGEMVDEDAWWVWNKYTYNTMKFRFDFGRLYAFGGTIELEKTFWMNEDQRSPPTRKIGYSHNGYVVALFGTVQYKPGDGGDAEEPTDCCQPLRDCEYDPDDDSDDDQCPNVPDNCKDQCWGYCARDDSNTCYYTRFGNGEACDASRDGTAIKNGFVDPADPICPFNTCDDDDDTCIPGCGETGQCGRGLIGQINDDTGMAYPPFDQIFPVTNKVGVEMVIRINNEGKIYLEAWSIPVGYYNVGPDEGDYYYVEGADSPVSVTDLFRTNVCQDGDGDDDCGLVSPDKWQFLSLDGITFTAKNAAVFQATSIFSSKMLPIHHEPIPGVKPISGIKVRPDVEPIPHMEPTEMIKVLQSPYVVTLLFIACSTIGIFCGITIKIISFCIDKRRGNYSKINIVNYNDTETE